jgi:ribosomal protein L37AE/L43A
MVTSTTCEQCGSTKVAFEFRDWFGDYTESVPPREAYGLWRVCTKCGNSWPEEGDGLYD